MAVEVVRRVKRGFLVFFPCVTSQNRSIHFSLFYPMLTFSLRLMVTHRLDSCDHLLYRLVTRYVLVSLLLSFTISNLCLLPYSLRLDFLYHTVQNNRVYLPIHPLSDPFKVFLSYLKYSRVTTSHQKLSKSPLDLVLETYT